MAEKLLTTEDVVRNLQNVQIYPTTHRVEINDKFAKIIFKFDLRSGQTYSFTEKKAVAKRNGKKAKPAIKTDFILYNPDEQIINLTEFDRAVLSACISEQKAGNQYTTINIIFRSLVGKVGDADIGLYPKTNQRAAIEHSLKNLMGAVVHWKNKRESLIAMGYLDQNEPFDLKASSLLPAELLDCKINGQPVEDVVYFYRTSPLLDIAEKNNQIVRYDAEYLDVPDQQNTPLIIALKTYVLRRVAEIKLHKQLTPTITFDDVFAKCDLSDANAKKKFYARDAILKLFEHLKNKNFIADFEPLKRGVSVYGVSFTK